jgi:hypothetical protein
MAEAKSQRLRIFGNKPFMRFARKFGSSSENLWSSLQEDPDADLGGGVFKYRLAREGEGTSGGGRAIVAMKAGQLIVMMYGFEKKDLDNIKNDELKAFRVAAKNYLALTDVEIADLLKRKMLEEIKAPAGRDRNPRTTTKSNLHQ